MVVAMPEFLAQRKYITCPQCGYTCKHIVSNLCWCPKCNLFLHGNANGVPLVDTDLREVLLTSTGINPEIRISLRQLELMKIINLCNKMDMNYISMRLERFITAVDRFGNEKTDYKRQLPRIFLSQSIEQFERENNVKVRYRGT